MSTPILATKLYIPPLRSNVVHRPRLIERLNAGLRGKLTLISAPAGSGKTTLVSEWIAQCGRPTAWLSLDESDNDPARFLMYLITALQTIAPHLGDSALRVLKAPQPPPTETMLTALLNDITTLSNTFVLVLDDYHVIESSSVDAALMFLLKHLPSQMHLVIATREQPQIPLARLRTRADLTELRAIDLRFTASEAAEFLNHVMGLSVSEDNILALESRTEGWIAGLQLAALSMQGHHDVSGFISSFSGSHHFVLDYLVEEVLHQQPEHIQIFLLSTSILDRLCGPLCDAVLRESSSGQATLEYLEHANLFIVPLDNERRWYRYHHLFGELLRQRLHQTSGETIAELHHRASVWYENSGLEIEAFHHATLTHDLERAERLMEGQGMPLLFRGAMTPVMSWLESLPRAMLEARPSLLVWYAFSRMSLGQANGIEEALQTAEAALQEGQPDDKTRDVIGRIAAIRSMMAIPQNDEVTMLVQSRRALDFLHPDNLPIRTATTWALGYAYQLRGDRRAAGKAYTEAISISEASGNMMFHIAAASSLATLQEADTHLHLAAETYRRVVNLGGDPPLPHANGAYFGLAQIFYEWNDLEAAQTYAHQGLHLSLQIPSIDHPASVRVLLARLKLAQGDVKGALTLLVQAETFARQHHFPLRLPEIAAMRILILLQQGHITAAAQLAQAHDLPLSQVRVHLAQGNPEAALTLLEPLLHQAEEKGWQDERLRIMTLLAVTYDALGEKESALHVLSKALTLAQPGGFIRLFVDEGPPMAHLLREAALRGIDSEAVQRLLTAFSPEKSSQSKIRMDQSRFVDSLSERELEVLQYIADGLTNPEIATALHLSLNTIKVHSRNIYSKLDVHTRVQAVARARVLGLLSVI